MSKNDYKLIALDLDGTLLRSDYTISQRTLDSLVKCSEKGYKIILCTGRRWSKVTPILADIPFPVYCALNNGVVLRWSEKKEPLYIRFFPFTSYKGLVEILRSMDLIPIVHIFTDEIDFIIDSYKPIENLFLADYIKRNDGRYKKINDLLNHRDDNIIQFCIMDDYKILQPAEEKIRSTYGQSLNIHVVRNVRYLGSALEILSPSASKYLAAKYVMELHGIKDDEMIAFGDDINDIELLKNAGLSFAMGNALEEVKDIANKVTASNDDDGIAIELEKLLLE